MKDERGGVCAQQSGRWLASSAVTTTPCQPASSHLLALRTPYLPATVGLWRELPGFASLSSSEYADIRYIGTWAALPCLCSTKRTMRYSIQPRFVASKSPILRTYGAHARARARGVCLCACTPYMCLSCSSWYLLVRSCTHSSLPCRRWSSLPGSGLPGPACLLGSRRRCPLL